MQLFHHQVKHLHETEVEDHLIMQVFCVIGPPVLKMDRRDFREWNFSRRLPEDSL